MKRAFGSLYKIVFLFGVFAFCGAAFGATHSSTLLQVSDSDPAYSETVTLTSITLPVGGFPLLQGVSGGTVSFYEDPVPAQPAIPSSPGYPTTPGYPAISGYPATPGILLGTANVNHGIAQWSQKFLGGQHKVYAVFNGNSAYPSSTSANVNLDVKSALAIPATGTAYLGFYGPETKTVGEGAATKAVEVAPPNGVGHTFALHLVYYAWSALPALLVNGQFQPNTVLADDISNNRVPIISWACDNATQNSDAIIASIGTANPLPGAAAEEQAITDAALGLAQISGPVLFRWAEEFNLPSANNGSCHGDPNDTTDGNPLDPPNNSKGWDASAYTNFIGAWREIWTLFQQAGATNVVFLWNPAHYNYADLGDQNPEGFYPGNTFIDWLGIDSYQYKNAAEPSGFDTFQDDVGTFYTDFTQPQYSDKPLMVGENGSQNYATFDQEHQAPYFSGVLSSFENNQYPDLKAYDYFDSSGSNGSCILDSEGGLAAFITLATNPLFDTTSLTASAPMATLAGGGSPLGGLEDLMSQATENQVPVSISLTDNGLLPVTNPQITAITDLKVVAGWGSVTGPSGPISFGTNLVAGETSGSSVTFTWPPTAVCVQMTVQYSATEATSTQAIYSGQNTITVSRFPIGQLCQGAAIH